MAESHVHGTLRIDVKVTVSINSRKHQCKDSTARFITLPMQTCGR